MPELIIDASNFEDFANDSLLESVQLGRGLIPRDFEAVPHGSMAFAPAFDQPNIPRSQWPSMIRAMEASQSRLSDVVRGAGLASLHQGSTNYCWANAPVNCVRVIRAMNNQPPVDLSPASVAAPIKHYQNLGGFGPEALKFIVTNGIAETSFWPANAIDRRFDTPEMRANALRHKVSEWYDLLPRNFDQLATCLLMGFPVAVGYDWWRHEVTALDLVEVTPGKFGVRIWNSWGDTWSEQGMAVLVEQQGTPDDAVAPRVVDISD
jgi:hypothetical protein